MRVFSGAVLLCVATANVGAAAAHEPVASQAAQGARPRQDGEPAVRLTVRDVTTGAPLAGALVDCGGADRIVTDSDGRGVVEQCTGEIDVRLAGYLPARVPVPRTRAALDVRLTPVRRAEDTVTVVGPAAGDVEAGVPAQVAISREELVMLRSVTFDDPLRTLQALPGVATSDELRAELSVRGSPFRQVGLVLDEVKSRLLVHTVRGVEQTGSVALLNADLIAAATLTPGAGPQRFGNTIGAELSIRTRPGRGDGLHGRAMASAIAATAAVEGRLGPSDRVTMIAGVRRSYASWIVRRVDPDVSGTFEFLDAQAKVDARLTARQSLSAGLLAGSSIYDERGRRTGANALDTGRNRTAMATVAWQAQVGSHWIVRQRAAGVGSRYRNENPDARPLDAGTEREWLSRSIVEWAPRAALSLDGALHVQHFVSGGTSTLYDLSTREPRPVLLHEGVQTLAGGHLHARWAPHRAATLAGGARVDRVSGVGGFVGGWLQAQVALSPAVVMTTAVSRNGQAPDVLQRFGPAGTRDLRYERGVLADVGMAWRGGPWGVAATTYLRRESEGLDTPDRPFRITAEGTLAGGNPRAPWRNALTGRARGAEIVVRRQQAPWTGWIGYSYGRTDYQGPLDADFAGAFDQRHLLTVTSSVEISGLWDASGTLRLATNWPYEGWFEQRAGEGVTLSRERHALRLPYYRRLDLRVRRRVPLPRGRLMLFAEVINVTNARNLRQVSASVNVRTFAVGRLSERQLPIIPAVGIAYEF